MSIEEWLKDTKALLNQMGPDWLTKEEFISTLGAMRIDLERLEREVEKLSPSNPWFYQPDGTVCIDQNVMIEPKDLHE